MLKSSKYT